jgi:hypothetical protein
MATSTRTDTHRPSAIDPADYSFIGVEFCKTEEVGQAMMLAEERKFIRAHMDRTGGTYSRHQHGGNCHVCGAHAIYTVLFHHRPTNTYIRTGEDCAEKMMQGDPAGFRAVGAKVSAARSEVKSAREAIAGKRKAMLILQDAGISRAWEIYDSTNEDLEKIGAIESVQRKYHCCPECRDYVGNHLTGCSRPEYELTEYTAKVPTDDLRILRDIVDRLVQYGRISEKQESFLARLVDQIDNRVDREREKAEKLAADRAAAADCPRGRTTIIGKPLSVKTVCSQYGDQQKWLVLSDEGFKVWGTIPALVWDQMAFNDEQVIEWDGERGRINPGLDVRVEFSATVTPSDDDAKFGFYSRPTKPSVEITGKD